MSTALRFAAIVVWAAVLVAMASWGEATLAFAGAVLATFALGVLVGRWWVVLAVLVPGIVLVLLSAAEGTDDKGEGSGLEWAVWVFVPATILAAAILALGVVCHRVARRDERSALSARRERA
jgi:hypothetical protein